MESFSNFGDQRSSVLRKAAWPSGLGTGVVIRRSRVQGLHHATSRICLSVVSSSNLRSHFVNSQLVCLKLFGILTLLCLFDILFQLFQWHACKLAKLSACIAKCITIIN